jgi:subtilisin family serine protease
MSLPSLSTYLNSVYAFLTDFAVGESFWTTFNAVYGTDYDVAKAAAIRHRWASRDFTDLPTIEVVSDQKLDQVQETDATTQQTIHLHEAFVTTATPSDLVQSLLAKVGQWLADDLNRIDTLGNEGDYFASLLLAPGWTGSSPAPSPVGDNSFTAVVGEEEITVEPSNTPMTNSDSGESSNNIDSRDELVRHKDEGTQIRSVPPEAVNGTSVFSYAQTTLIVKFKPTVQTAQAEQYRSLFGVIDRQRINLTGAEIWQLSGSMTVDEILARYNSDANFDYIQPDYVWQPTLAIPNDPDFNQLWGLHNTGQSGGRVDADIDAPEAWEIQTGNPNFVIGVIDTGVDYTHPDLAGNIWTNPGEVAGNGIDDDGNGYIDDVRGWDFAYNDNDPMDVDGHGTHVAGTIAGRGNNGIGVAGVAWNAKIMPLKFLNDQGSGSTSDAIAAIAYATAQGVKLTNNSWGGGGYNQALYDAINAAGQAGALFIAAAGNDSNNNDASPSYPASYNLANIVSVASTTRTDSLSSFSNYGATSVDLGAPGSSIYSSVPNGGYATYSGTSMATPHVTGAAALVWSQNPTWTAQQVKDTLMNTGDSLAALAGKTVSGKRLNVFNALAAANLPAVTVSVSPASVQEDGSTNLVYTFTRTGTDLSSPLTVNFTVSGQANAAPGNNDPADYTLVTGNDVSFDPTTKQGTVSFAANATTVTVVVDPITDSVAETEDETVSLSIVGGVGYISGSSSIATGTIISEESLPIFSNPNAITIPDSGAGNPYPSIITVSGLGSSINSLQVTLTDLSHTWPDDIDVLLVGPTGLKALLMSDVGGGDNINGITLTFDPEAIAFLPDIGPLSSGTYKPTNFDTLDLFDLPAPSELYDTDLSIFNNTNPNGAWSLYLMDDEGLDSGSLGGGWSLTIDAVDGDTNSAPVITSGTSTNFAENATGSVYTVTATDPDGDLLTYSLGGPDAALFDINNSNGVVTFKTAPDYENPADDGRDNTYNITVSASDGSLSSSPQNVAIAVTDVEESEVYLTLKILEDNNGTPGNMLTNGAIPVGDSFFVEILVEDSRSNAAGIVGGSFDVSWDANVLEALSFEITSNLPFAQQGSLDNATGLANDLGGGSVPGSGRPIGVNSPERFALIQFQSELISVNTLINALDFQQFATADGLDVTVMTPEAIALDVLSAPEISILDSSQTTTDHAVQFTTPLSLFRNDSLDSPFVRSSYADTRQYIDITNSGNGGALEITGIRVNATDVSLDYDFASQGDILLNPGESQRIGLRYAPTSAGQNFSLADGLVILSNALNAPEAEVALAGRSTYNADINYDGVVSFGDLGPLTANWGRLSTTTPWDPTADINGDGFVSFGDLGQLNQQWGQSVASV